MVVLRDWFHPGASGFKCMCVRCCRKKARTEPTRPLGRAESPHTSCVPRLSPCRLVPTSETCLLPVQVNKPGGEQDHISHFNSELPPLRVLLCLAPLCPGSSNAQAQRGKPPGDGSLRPCSGGERSARQAVPWSGIPRAGSTAPLTLTLLSHEVSLSVEHGGRPRWPPGSGHCAENREQ